MSAAWPLDCHTSLSHTTATSHRHPRRPCDLPSLCVACMLEQAGVVVRESSTVTVSQAAVAELRAQQEAQDPEAQLDDVEG